MAAPLLQLWKLSDELGAPGAQALWTAARRRKINVTRKQVESWLKSRGERQIFAPVQPARGKTIAEDDNRWMMDLIDLGASKTAFKFFLVCVNVFDRFVYARPLRTKEPTEVKAQLEDILRTARKPQIVSSDNGAEFRGPVSTLLTRRGIAQKFKDPQDVNALGVIDRAIGLLKKRLAQESARTKKSWPALLQGVVGAMNKTPKEVLHGAAPEEIRNDPEVTFMLLQEQARAIQHNVRLGERRAEALEGGHFRAPLATSKFARGFRATYGDVRQVARVEGSRVVATDGSVHAIKSVKVVPVGTSAASAPAEAPRGGEIVRALEDLLAGEERMSISRAAALLKEQLSDYAALLGKRRLIDVVRRSERLKLVEMPHGAKTWYYIALR